MALQDDALEVAREWLQFAQTNHLDDGLVDQESIGLLLAARQSTLDLAEAMNWAAGVGTAGAIDPPAAPASYGPNVSRLRTAALRSADADPVGSFATLLELYPRPPLPHPPEHYARFEARTETEERLGWVQRLALSGQTAWLQERERLSPNERWRVIEDATALANAIDFVDPRIKHLAHKHGAPAEITEVLESPESGLRVVAREVHHLAQLTHNTPSAEVEATTGLRAVRVQSPKTLLEAQRRLEQFIRDDAVSPDTMMFLVGAQKRVLGRLTETAGDAPEWAASARQALRTVQVEELNTIRATPEPKRAPTQMLEIVRYTHSAATEELAPVAPNSLRAAAACLQATHSRIQTELAGPDWVITNGALIDANPEDLLWQPTRFTHDPPRLATAVGQAATIAAPHAQTPAPATAHRERAADLLAELRTRQSQRPRTPADLPVDDRLERLRQMREQVESPSPSGPDREGPRLAPPGPSHRTTGPAHGL